MKQEENYTTVIDGKLYQFGLWKLENEMWLGNAFHKGVFVTTSGDPNPEKLALKLVKKIESNGK